MGIQSIKFKDFEKYLNENDFYSVRSKGSHIIFKRKSDGATFTVPQNSKHVNGVLLIQFKRRFINNKGQMFF